MTADQHPDHDTIATFRRRHLKALSSLFVQVLLLCRKAGLVELGHVSLDGTKVKANASKHKAMSYARMEQTAKELEEDVQRLLTKAQGVDRQEDGLYGKGIRGDELPEELRFKESRLRKIREAMKSLEAEAKEKAKQEQEAAKKQEDDPAQTAKNRKGKKRRTSSGKPEGKAQRNFTDPESRIMKDGATESFEQCYNCQAAAEESQVIVATGVTQEANDQKQVQPMVEAIKANLDGRVPKKMTKDSGYFSEENVRYLEKQEIDAYVAVGRDETWENPCGSSQWPNPEGNENQRTHGAGNCARRRGREFTGNESRLSNRSSGRSRRPEAFAGFFCVVWRRSQASGTWSASHIMF